jgi:hypothetical protein
MRATHFTKMFPVLVSILSGSLIAGVVPGRWEKVDTQRTGAELTIILKSGDRIDGVLKGTTPDSLTIVAGNSEQLLPKSQVQRVQTLHNVHRNRGLASGMAVGALAAIPGALVGNALSDADHGKNTAIGAVSFGAIGAGIGAAIGFAFDKAHEAPEVLYEAK